MGDIAAAFYKYKVFYDFCIYFKESQIPKASMSQLMNSSNYPVLQSAVHRNEEP